MNILRPLAPATPLARSTSTASNVYNTNTTSEARRSTRKKDFQYKHGIKVHAYDNEKAPYPLSYDRTTLELDALDHKLVQHIAKSVSFASLDEPPTRVLDLGCGTGAWVIDAAKEWTDCQFVGFDLVDVQIPLRFLDPLIANRIIWRHGNFLTTKLPFEDDEFDFVHLQSIARGVPENKWGILFEEISRILRPDGTVEVVEDDIIFPTLPKWFTNALRVRPMRDPPLTMQHKSLSSYGGQSSQLSSSSSGETPPHDHALLESLHSAVYESRFINLKPLAILPSYLTTYFRAVNLGPITSFPMPPLAPIRPLPPQIGQSYAIEPALDVLERRTSMASPPPQMAGTRPVSLSFSSFSAFSIASTAATITESKYSQPSRPRTSSEPFAPFNDHSSLLSSTTTLRDDITTQPLPHRFTLDDETVASVKGVKNLPAISFHRQQVETLSERSLAMQLYRSYQAVLACEEAMWEELKDRIRNRRDELIPFRWDDDEELEELQSRNKFEKLIERYRTDMQTRISFWCSLEDFGWESPAREPLSKAELVEEERLRECMIEARKQATMEELLSTCRSVRVAIGQKP
ncbi:S-adenosyl-L-methionine-dependent methyltransferase [Crepidotus variabilis]|uniref:S-adenosyl-L-methionine-dependent methyltransferase n=1 Tax=Crepidotus variabilis TaxID=179855 RepID=A0A9P6EVE7_9AGAR|nr:S-adenosyl-L-methionine-dependent methyltransferase [Crepidotus variabilis]